MLKRLLGGILVWGALVGGALQAAPILTLLPVNGQISGAPGQTIGFGFTLTNSDPDYIVVTNSDFCPGVPTSPCSNPLGTYTDIIGQNFIIVGPSPESTTVSQAFNLAAQTGAGSFLINSNATLGTTVTGQLILTYDVYASDPVNGGDPTNESLTVSAAASIKAMAPASVPEPATALLLSGAAGALAFYRRRRA